MGYLSQKKQQERINLFLNVTGFAALAFTLVVLFEPSWGIYHHFINYYFQYYIVLLVVFCYALYVIGSQMESFMGKGKYLIIYLFSGLIGSLTSITLNGEVASLGASGAIFGLMGSMLYFGYHYRVYLGNVLKSQLIPLIIINLVIGMFTPGVDNFAHIGGLIGGILITISLGVKYKSTDFEKINGWIVTTLFTLFMIYMGIFAFS